MPTETHPTDTHAAVPTASALQEARADATLYARQATQILRSGPNETGALVAQAWATLALAAETRALRLAK